ncbi:MAG TPA: hypothetical protein VL053_12315 [Arachidicoccus sp.]|nr:hypothetical protein [Arachidicoccus sp.]
MRLDFKKVIDNDGTFQVSVPLTWRYWVMEGNVHSFEDNEDTNDSDCFQISLKLLTEKERNKLSDALGYLPPDKKGDFDCRSHQDEVSDEGCVIKSWSTIYSNYHVYFTYAYEKVSEEKYHKVKLENKLKVINDVFASFHMLHDDERERIMTSYRFEMFLQGLAATNFTKKSSRQQGIF